VMETTRCMVVGRAALTEIGAKGRANANVVGRASTLTKGAAGKFPGTTGNGERNAACCVELCFSVCWVTIAAAIAPPANRPMVTAMTFRRSEGEWGGERNGDPPKVANRRFTRSAKRTNCTSRPPSIQFASTNRFSLRLPPVSYHCPDRSCEGRICTNQINDSALSFKAFQPILHITSKIANSCVTAANSVFKKIVYFF